MPNTLQGVIDYARTHPTRDGGSWSGWCASFCFRAGGFSRAYINAMSAGDASGWLNPNWGQAPAGALHYWAGVGGDGHVAFELGGGRLLMASNSVTDRWGTALGTVSFTDYARLGIPYRGWSMRWGSETLSGASVAGGSTAIINNSGDDMYDQAARDEVIGAIHLAIQEVRNLAAAFKSRQTAPVYELVRADGDPQVWFSSDRDGRTPVADARTLADYQYFIRMKGQDPNVKVVSNLNAFGPAGS